MRVEQKADINDVNNSSPMSSIPPSPRSGNSPFIDPNSSIGPAGAPPEVKSFLTWVYEGFCSILSAIWNLFFPPVEPPPRSRDGSDGHLSSLSDSPPPSPVQIYLTGPRELLPLGRMTSPLRHPLSVSLD